MEQASSIRAHQIMRGVLPEQRRQSRVQLPVSAQVFPAKGDAWTAHLRDLNILGAFFYSDLKVTVGDSVRVELTPQSIPNFNVNCEATVVRVEESGFDGLEGIAVQFHDFMVKEPGETQKDVSKPFVTWDVDMVDQKFARRPELQTCAWRIQGAA